MQHLNGAGDGVKLPEIRNHRGTFVLTIDVEIDAGRKWKTSNPASYDGVTRGIPILQRLCDEYGVTPTYLISPAVMVDRPSVDFLNTLDRDHCELGTHLHGEYIEPMARFPGEDFSGCDPKDMQCEYAKEIEFAKLENLTEKFVKLFGVAPKSFRAGRFGARGWTLECLERLGYSHDSSVTPFRNWFDVADFSQPGSLAPYHPSQENICCTGDSAILEVPVSITPDLQWLRPTPRRFSDFEQCQKVIDWYEQHTSPTVLCAMFHNVELVANKSPYCRSEADCEEMLGRIIIGSAKIANTTVGHIDHAMAYLSGFHRLGHEVYLMEHVGANRCVDSNNRKIPFHNWAGLSHFEAVAKSYGIWPRCCLINKGGESTCGMTYGEAVKVAKRADLLFARSGQIHKAAEIFLSARRRAYFDGNPGSTQVAYREQGGSYEALDRYDHLFTLGLNIGAPCCSIPTEGRRWHPAVRPVFLPMWPKRNALDPQRFTTISTWKGRGTFEWQGSSSGEKSDNWLRFLDLPKRTTQKLEIALKIDSADQQPDGELFRQNGCQLTDPQRLRQLDDYRDYIGQSRGEFSVAHNRYVEFSTGWFSDRSALYLASGRPVLVQSTGIENYLPTGKGLLTFSTMAEAAAGIERINGDYSGHCKAAREIAEEFFDSDKVLRKVLSHTGHC